MLCYRKTRTIVRVFLFSSIIVVGKEGASFFAIPLNKFEDERRQVGVFFVRSASIGRASAKKRQDGAFQLLSPFEIKSRQIGIFFLRSASYG